MTVSKYLQIKQHLLRNIESGHWPEYSPVPSENMLAAEFNVSRMTARRALQELSDQGVIVRNQGAASYVASLKSQSSMLAIRNIADEILERGHQHKAQCLQLHTVPATPNVAANLGLSSGADVYRSLVLHWENQQILQLEERFVNPKVAPDYLQQDFEHQTTHDYLTQILPLTEAEHLVEAIVPDAELQKLLAIQEGTASLRVTRRTWSKKASVSYAILTHPGDRYRLGSHLTFG